MGIRMLLAGDDGTDRAAVLRMFSGIHDIAVIGEARASGPLLPILRRLDPDVMVFPIGADVDEALTTMVEVHARAPRTGLVVLASPQAHADARLAVGLGAHAFLAKGCEVHELVDAVREARASWVSHGGKTIPGQPPHAATTTNPTPPNEWERQVIALIAAGCKHAAIAERMGSSYKAIQGCHARIRHEMRLESRVDFVRYAAREGLLDLPA